MDVCRRPDKRRFTSRKRGKAYLRAQRARGRFRDGHVSVYRCDCGFFHLGRLSEYVVAGYALDRQNRRQRAA